MTTITINNPNNFNLAMLKKILNAVGVEVLKIEETEQEFVKVSKEEMESIKKGLLQAENGDLISNEEVQKKARQLCTK